MPDRHAAPAPAPAACLPALGPGECLLVRSLRRMATGRQACPLVARGFLEVCGAGAPAAIGAFAALLRALATAGRRRLGVAHPGCGALTGDECRLLILIAAVQAGESGRAAAQLDWIAHPESRAVLGRAVDTFAAILAAHGLRLALPEPVPPPHRTGRPVLRPVA